MSMLGVTEARLKVSPVSGVFHAGFSPFTATSDTLIVQANISSWTDDYLLLLNWL